MSRIFKVTAIAAVLSFACCSFALASVRKVTGGTAQIALSSAATSRLAAGGVSLAPIAPATASGSTLSFPISGGRLNLKNLHGRIRESGGMVISHGTRQIRLRRLELVSGPNGVWVSALVRRPRTACAHPAKGHCGVATRRRVRIARVGSVKISAGSATGKLRLTAVAAKFINNLAGKPVAGGGALVGTITVTPQLG